MIPYRPDDIFYKAFKNALNIAKQNSAKITLVKSINYPAGIGLDESIIMDMVSREYDVYKFDKILPNLQKEAIIAGVKLQIHVIDLRLSPAKAFVDFVSKNDVDLMVIGSIRDKGWTRHFTSDTSQEIMDLNPSCSVILVE
jgi:nucleotide-binding universal stress UspA family protein